MQIVSAAYNARAVTKLTRRTCLAAAALPLLRGANAVPILDAHTHFYDPRRSQGVPWPPKSDPVLYRPVLPDEFVGLTSPLGVKGTVVIEASAWLEDNQWILDLAKDHPVIRGFIGHLSPGENGFASHLKRFSANPLFRGIRLGDNSITAGLQSPMFLKDMERLAGEDLVLDAIGGPKLYDSVLSLARRIPNLRIILDHLPLDNDPGSQALEALGRETKVVAKVSGVLRKGKGDRPADYQESLDRLWRIFGPERLVYASNWPVSDKMAPYGVVLEVVKDYFDRKPGDAASRFFSGNGTAFYNVTCC